MSANSGREGELLELEGREAERCPELKGRAASRDSECCHCCHRNVYWS
jgi:hypothetical protein